MNDKCFVTVWAVQQAEIEKYCFGSCGKAFFGLLMDSELGGLSLCYEPDCPALDFEMDEPFGEIVQGLVYLRKLASEGAGAEMRCFE